MVRLWNWFCKKRADYWFYNRFATENVPNKKWAYWNNYNKWLDRKL